MCKIIPFSLKEANVINGERNCHVDISDVCLLVYLSHDKLLRSTDLPHQPLHFVVVYLFIYFCLVWFFRIWPVKRLKKHPWMWSKFLQYLLVQQIWFCKRFSDNLSFTTIAAGLPSIQEKFHLKVRRQKIVFIATSPWYKYYLQHSYARVGIRY